MLEFLTITNDLQIQLFHFLSKFDVHLIDFRVELFVLFVEMLLRSGNCTDKVSAITTVF